MQLSSIHFCGVVCYNRTLTILNKSLKKYQCLEGEDVNIITKEFIKICSNMLVLHINFYFQMGQKEST
jgi:hypothetical protein